MIKLSTKKIILNFLISIISLTFLFLLLEYLNIGFINFKFIEIPLFCAFVINAMSFLFISQKQYYKHFFLMFIFFISIIFLYNYKTTASYSYAIKFIIAFYIGITDILLILSCILYKRFKLLSYTVQFILLFPTLFIWQFFFISNSFVSYDIILTIFQTNFSEAKSYIYTFIGLKQYIGLFILLLISFFILKYNNKLKLKNITDKKNLTILIILISLNIFLIYRYKEDNIATQVIQDTVKYLKSYKDFKKRISERKFDDIIFTEKDNINKGIYVLVLGESQNREHMSAYGYKKQTTPWLDGLKEYKNLIIFKNGYSCHTYTSATLPYVLTSKNQYNNITLSKAISVLDIAQAANIKTAWLSNQVHYSFGDNPISVIADTAQQQKWINKNITNVTDTNFYDINLVEELKKIKIYDDMLIVIHLMGNHWHYANRYPKQFENFKQADKPRVAQYDNSILYNDFVMKNIFEVLKEIPNFKALIYCSDHGEEVERFLAHDPTHYVPSMIKIPLYVYLSDSYIKDNPEIYTNLNNNKNYYFTNDLLFNLMLGILNIKISDVYEKNNDITSKSYDSNKSRFKTLYNAKNIED